MKDLKTLQLECLKAVLRPIVHYCMRRSISIQTFFEFSKVLFLEVAEEQMRNKRQKVNISRLSVATGLHRRDVMRIYDKGAIDKPSPSIASRVIGQWEQDSRFQTKAKKPKLLKLDKNEFNKLVALVSKDVHPGTVLFELERMGAVERTAKGLRLKTSTHVIKGDPSEGIRLLGIDLRDIIAAVYQNLFDNPTPKNLHARTEYDNISMSDLPTIRQWMIKEGAAFHSRIRNYLSQFDLDINPKDSTEGGVRVVLGTFSYTEANDDA